MRYALPVGIMLLEWEGQPAEASSLAGERKEAVRFGIEVPQDAPFATLIERWHQAEELGFDHLWVADHLADTRTDHSGAYRNLGGTWFDGWTVLAVMAKETTRIRIGTLVSNPVLRPPALLAKEALTIDHLSRGRLELGIGTGIEPLDHATMGLDYWSPQERVARFSEYVEVVDELMRSPSRAYAFEGRYYRTWEAAMGPPPIQQPRPPITVGGQSPTVLRVAAERADCWNTAGPLGVGMDEILETTRQQNERLDELCVAFGREPTELRRSLFMVGALDAWASPEAVERIVRRFGEIGIDEFVLFWPPDERLDLFERVATEVIPSLKTGVLP
jgi:alkanesulfonate monooxygenase SsuD/methylene tetrahydromethanopterin reductase-like flavin-dependent oxidoreductase (luciferase family)